jgi:Immunoglobulin domain
LFEFGQKVAPKIAPFSFGDDEYTQGMSAQINCIVIEGDLPIDISWTFHGRHSSGLSSSSGIETTKIGSRSSVLNIESVSAEHSGNFTCIARNSAGVRNSTTALHVYGTGRPS